MTDTPDLLLGLIGDNIAKSRSPLLHRLAGQQNGITVRYDRLVPKDMEMDFDAVFDYAKTHGYRGINITYPYKERVCPKLIIEDPLVKAIGACNTALFDADGIKGQNTDYTGFVAAYRNVRGEAAPGVVTLIGTGGVGRAIAFGLIALEAEEIRLVDKDLVKAEGLAADLRGTGAATRVVIETVAETAAEGANGVINATPVGMVGYGGTPIHADALTQCEWVFDAVYTPVDTPFLQDAEALGLAIISGYELYIYQGVHAWGHFAGLPLDEAALRQSLLEAPEEAA